MKNSIKLLFLLFGALLFTSCEDPIDITLDQGESQLVVDAFINNLNEKQIVKLMMSTPYFDNSSKAYAEGAVIELRDSSGRVYNFTPETNGVYSYTPIAGDDFCKVGTKYELVIKYKGEEFYANSLVNPVPPIDSIRITEEDDPFAGKKVKLAEFFANDLKGRRDFYWIKTFYNDTLKKLENADNSSDGAFSGDGADGLPFITPMRYTINKNGGQTQYLPGDTIRVQLLSITEDTYNWLFDVFSQTTNGGLFATPPYNVRTNIKNRNSQSKTKAYGYFCTSAISQAGLRFK